MSGVHTDPIEGTAPASTDLFRADRSEAALADIARLAVMAHAAFVEGMDSDSEHAPEFRIPKQFADDGTALLNAIIAIAQSAGRRR